MGTLFTKRRSFVNMQPTACGVHDEQPGIHTPMGRLGARKNIDEGRKASGHMDGKVQALQ